MPDSELLVATRKGLFIYEHTGGLWQVKHRAFLGDHVVNVLHDPRDGSRYAALKHGHFGPKLQRSDDGGATWSEIGTPTYPERPADREPDLCPFRGTEIAWKLDMVWEMGIDYSSNGGLWAGTLPGGLFHSADRGDSWELNWPLWDRPERKKWAGGGYDLPGIHSILTRPDAPQHITVGISCGGAWRSDDSGANWAIASQGMRNDYMPPDQAFDPDTQDPHLIDWCNAQPQCMWTQHHNGVFKTTDGGENWTEINEAGPSVFGFAVAVHPTDPGTAWFVPAVKDEHRVPVDGKFVVTRTRDGGESFDVLSRGLPQGEAYDLVYRHGLALHPGGDLLAMGSTTGSLWVSGDQGDSWEQVTAHLPPVYAVKWG